MNDSSPIESRIGGLISAYADRAPVDVDPMAMARLAASARRSVGPVSLGFDQPSLRLGLVLLALALAIAMVGGALVVGGPFERDGEEILTERQPIEPFIGLPPVGVAPSSPESGELVLGFMGRVSSYGLRFTQVYADGRLITGADRPGTYDVVEQHLTREGVDLMRSAVLSNTTLDPDLSSLYTEPNPRSRGGGPGAVWASMQAQVGDQRFQVGWSDADLPARIVDPGSWLPAHAWLDRRAMPYVASRFAVCVDRPRSWSGKPVSTSALEANEGFALLPESIKSLIRSRAIEGTPRREDARCLYEVTTADARVIAATLDGAMDPTDVVLRWTTGELPSGKVEVMLELLRVLPDGGSVCNCG